MADGGDRRKDVRHRLTLTRTLVKEVRNMAGPCSQPAGDKSRWQELNELVCNIHFRCFMEEDETHDFITYREWLAKRNRLRTGKTK